MYIDVCIYVCICACSSVGCVGTTEFFEHPGIPRNGHTALRRYPGMLESLLTCVAMLNVRLPADDDARAELDRWYCSSGALAVL